MPNNDDALKNLTRCYTRIGNYEKSFPLLKKLHHIKSSDKTKVIAYILLAFLLEDFDCDGGATSSSRIINFVKQKFNVVTNDDEITVVMRRINDPYNRDIIAYMIGGFGVIGSEDYTTYLTTKGTTRDVIEDEIRDVLNW